MQLQSLVLMNEGRENKTTNKSEMKWNYKSFPCGVRTIQIA